MTREEEILTIEFDDLLITHLAIASKYLKNKDETLYNDVIDSVKALLIKDLIRGDSGLLKELINDQKELDDMINLMNEYKTNNNGV